MDELQDLLSFQWFGSKKNRFTKDKWGDSANCRPLGQSTRPANALLTGYRQLDKTKRWKLVAVDLDKKDNWEEVIATFKALELPQTLTVATPSGGFHIFFWVQKDVPAQNINDDRHCKNFELKGDNGNITAPLSVFDDGSEYKVVRDAPIARLLAGEAYRLCKFKQEWRPPLMPDDFIPDKSDVEGLAKQYDQRAKRNPRGWQLRCPFHEDRQASAVLFNSGWLYCSGCGAKQRLITKDV